MKSKLVENKVDYKTNMKLIIKKVEIQEYVIHDRHLHTLYIFCMIR